MSVLIMNFIPFFLEKKNCSSHIETEYILNNKSLRVIHFDHKLVYYEYTLYIVFVV